jgi:hypothetical protein
LDNYPGLPSKKELEKLPTRAVVAYAVRNARRVQPLFQKASEIENHKKQTRLIHKAITLSQRWVNGENISSEDLAIAKGIVYHTTDSTAYFATASASASSHTAAYAYAYEAANSACNVIKPDGSINVTAANTDFQKLVSLNLSNDDGIDASENGPLGPYWPDGKEPDWYKELYPKMRALLDEPDEEDK